MSDRTDQVRTQGACDHGEFSLVSICIPQYNRCEYLLKVLDSIREQDYPHIEVVISDDCSTDATESAIPAYASMHADQTHVRFRYIRQAHNVGYDANLRTALGAGTGDYLFVLGNDDALAGPTAISTLARVLTELEQPDVAFTNIHSYGNPNRRGIRTAHTKRLGRGPGVAAATFRSFSFVGGIAFKRSAFRLHDTAAFDGSIYVQIYLAARIIASGGVVGAISDVLVAKDVRLGGQTANSYRNRLAAENTSLRLKTGGLEQVGHVACEAILPYVTTRERSRFMTSIYKQLLLFSYAYWLLAYRQDGVYRAAVNLALGCEPWNLTRLQRAPISVRLRLLHVYVLTTIGGLALPVWLLERAGRLLKLARSR